MKQYETTFIVNPTLSGDEIKQAAQMYVDFLRAEGCEIVHLDEMGVLQLAYPINRRTSGAYFWMEYNANNGEVVSKLELAFRRDDNVLRYLTIAVDKNRSQYNSDKRAGKFILTEEERKAKKNRTKRKDDDEDDDAVLDLDL